LKQGQGRFGHYKDIIGKTDNAPSPAGFDQCFRPVTPLGNLNFDHLHVQVSEGMGRQAELPYRLILRPILKPRKPATKKGQRD
jgi:hypothetical protein